MEDWKKAKTRPRVSSSTSSPTMVKPVAYAIPDERAEQHHEQDDHDQDRHQADERERHRRGRDA